MRNSLDRFFRDKLSDHPVATRPEAWSRIDQNISKKNNGWKTWLRAASIVLLLGIAFIIWRATNQADEKTKPQLAEKSVQKEKIELPNEQTEKAVEPNEPVSSKKENRPVATATAKTPKNKQELNKEVTPAIEQGEPAVVETDLLIAETTNEPINELPQATETTNESQVADKAMVVVYTLELPKELAEAREKKTGLKRVLELAREARSTENPIGELRQAKNELLAFEFGKDKEQRNNK